MTELERLRTALRNLVDRCDTTELADGSNIDTVEGHAALGDFEAAFEELEHCRECSADLRTESHFPNCAADDSEEDHGSAADVPENDDQPTYISDGSSYKAGYRTFRDGSYREDFRSDC